MKLTNKLFLIFAFVLILISCGKDEPDYNVRSSFFENIYFEEADSVITCLTYNIQLGFIGMHDPWNKDHIGGTKEQISDLKNIIMEADPDIVCLQEVPRNRYNIVIKNFIQELAKELNMNYAFGAHGFNDPYGIVPVQGEWGNAILTKYEILSIDNRENEYRDVWERRSILMANLKLNDSLDVYAYSLHFLPSPDAVPNSIGFFAEQAIHTQLILGDFNMGHVPEYDDLGYTDISKTDSTISFGIDRIYVTEGHFEIIETGTVEGSATVSDHPANYCTLRIK